MAEETKTTVTETEQNLEVSGADLKAEGGLADQIRRLLGLGP